MSEVTDEMVEAAARVHWREGPPRSYLGQMRTMRRALEAALAARPKVQEGWQLVPKEPTLEMLKAGYSAIKLFTNNEINIGQFRVYEAMLATAPSPPTDGSK